MKGQLANNFLKKTASLALFTIAGVLLSLPVLAETNINPEESASNIIAQTQPGTEGLPNYNYPDQTDPNFGETDSDTNRMNQNRTGNENYPTGNTNSNYNNSDTVVPDRTENQNYPSGTTNTDNDNNRMNNTGTYDTGDTGAVRGMW